MLVSHTYINICQCSGSVRFGLPGSWSVIICMDPHPSINKKVKKNLNFNCDFLVTVFKDWCKCTSSKYLMSKKSKKTKIIFLVSWKLLTKKTGARFWSRSVIQCTDPRTWIRLKMSLIGNADYYFYFYFLHCLCLQNATNNVFHTAAARWKSISAMLRAATSGPAATSATNRSGIYQCSMLIGLRDPDP